MRKSSSKYTVWKKSGDLCGIFIQFCRFVLIFQCADICWLIFFLQLLIFNIFNLGSLLQPVPKTQERTDRPTIRHTWGTCCCSWVYTQKSLLPQGYLEGKKMGITWRSIVKFVLFLSKFFWVYGLFLNFSAAWWQNFSTTPRILLQCKNFEFFSKICLVAFKNSSEAWNNVLMT